MFDHTNLKYIIHQKENNMEMGKIVDILADTNLTNTVSGEVVVVNSDLI